jgi:hypothetical protein
MKNDTIFEYQVLDLTHLKSIPTQIYGQNIVWISNKHINFFEKFLFERIFKNWLIKAKIFKSR